MNLVLFLSVLVAVSADLKSLNLEDWTYTEGDRFFHFPGDDGVIYLVEATEVLDRSAISNFTDSPDNGYWLFTRLNPTYKQVLKMGDKNSVCQSNFDPNKITVFIAHGWMSDGNSDINFVLKKVFLDDADVNVITLDWGEVAMVNYVTAKAAVAEIGSLLGLFIDWLQREFHLSLDRVHLVGHSLGAHLVGNAGKTLNGDVKRITALDPAGPLWYRDKRRVSSAHALYVEVIHTNAYQCGYPLPSGHADHYPNGGQHMPGCGAVDVVCNHARSWRYLAASVERNQFRAHKCHYVAEASNDECFGRIGLMGNSDINKEQYGVYRVNTGADYPFI